VPGRDIYAACLADDEALLHETGELRASDAVGLDVLGARESALLD